MYGTGLWMARFVEVYLTFRPLDPRLLRGQRLTLLEEMEEAAWQIRYYVQVVDAGKVTPQEGLFDAWRAGRETRGEWRSNVVAGLCIVSTTLHLSRLLEMLIRCPLQRLSSTSPTAAPPPPCKGKG